MSSIAGPKLLRELVDLLLSSRPQVVWLGDIYRYSDVALKSAIANYYMRMHSIWDMGSHMGVRAM